MKKIVVLFAGVFCGVLHAMDGITPELKIVWSYPLKQCVTYLNLQEYTLVGYDWIKCDDTGKYLEMDSAIEWQGNKYIGHFSVGEKIIKDESCLHILDQGCKKAVAGNASHWKLKNKNYTTYMVTQLDSLGNEYSCWDFRAKRFVWDAQQHLAVALLDRYQRQTNTINEVWYVCSALKDSKFAHMIEINVLKKLPTFDAEVLEVRILPGGKTIVFFLKNGTIVFISPDEVKAPRIKGTRVEFLSDIFFRFV